MAYKNVGPERPVGGSIRASADVVWRDEPSIAILPDNFQPIGDQAADVIRTLARRLGMPLHLARTVAELAGIGGSR